MMSMPPCNLPIKTAPSTYSWTLTRNVEQSNNFFVSELKSIWCFKLMRRDGDGLLLYLCHLGAGSIQLNLHIVLRYWGKTETFTLKKLRKQITDPPYSLYLLATGKFGICAVTCEFIDIGDKGTLIGLFPLSKNLHDLFLNEDDSDIIIKVGDCMYPAHKAIIRARSPVFHAMLNHNMIEKHEGIINIPDCDPDIFRDFLLYLYSGKLDNISLENVFEFFRISDKYGVTDMRDGCVGFILDNLSIDIFGNVITLATTYNEKKLLTVASEFFTDFEKDILESEKWKKFVSDDPLKANDIFMNVFQNVSENPMNVSDVSS